ncbi:MAG: bifunctional YncE family protein/alkaline phosphatase family protein [Bryobacteraceae bacterium]|nr:bifunctional YncE family protein/alkaline phosphatase family protein [Bryobacteraceae bacterium]
MKLRLALPIAVCATALIVTSQPGTPERVGPDGKGGFLLPIGWTLRPAGRHVGVDTLPMTVVQSPDARWLVVLNGGRNKPSLSVIDARTEKEVQRLTVADLWLGLTFNRAGDRLYAGGGAHSRVYEFSFVDGRITPAREFAGPAPANATDRVFLGDVTLSPDESSLIVTSLYQDSLLEYDLGSGALKRRIPTASRPYRARFTPDGKSLMVSSWGNNRVLLHDPASGAEQARLNAGLHPTDFIFDGKGRLFVAAANTNTVAVFRESEGRWLRAETLNVALTPRQPVGMTPSALALSPKGDRLYVVCSDANAVAVADVSGKESRVLGWIPVGWYPTAVHVLPKGTLAVLSGRGMRSYANAKPTTPGERPTWDYVGSIQTGTVSFIDEPNTAQLRAHSETVRRNSPYRDQLLDAPPVPAGHVLLAEKIRHVVYIIKENRTYDQVLGDMAEGNGEPSLAMFGEEITPNHHKLAREYALFDNFYVNADVSADGHNWSMAAIAPDFVQKVWPSGYGGRGARHSYRWGQEIAAMPPNGYIWSLAHAAGHKIRSFGYLGVNKPLNEVGADGIHVSDVLDPILKNSTNFRYRDYGLEYRDIERAKVFLEDLAEHEKRGEWANFVLIRLGNDHTEGARAGRPTPEAHVADNDWALGMIVEGISKSKFWPQTAIFVLEDDAQNGPDHVDSHRSPAFVISPYSRRPGVVDSTFYNTTSMLRTMEILLGLAPMTVFDASARPMTSAFVDMPDARPYVAEKARIDIDQRNPGGTLAASLSEPLDFSDADTIDDHLMNEILWLAVKKTEPPAPVRSWFGRD